MEHMIATVASDPVLLSLIGGHPAEDILGKLAVEFQDDTLAAALDAGAEEEAIQSLLHGDSADDAGAAEDCDAENVEEEGAEYEEGEEEEPAEDDPVLDEPVVGAADEPIEDAGEEIIVMPQPPQRRVRFASAYADLAGDAEVDLRVTTYSHMCRTPFDA
jgi:hypothetical protein